MPTYSNIKGLARGLQLGTELLDSAEARVIAGEVSCIEYGA